MLTRKASVTLKRKESKKQAYAKVIADTMTETATIAERLGIEKMPVAPFELLLSVVEAGLELLGADPELLIELPDELWERTVAVVPMEELAPVIDELTTVAGLATDGETEDGPEETELATVDPEALAVPEELGVLEPVEGIVKVLSSTWPSGITQDLSEPAKTLKLPLGFN